MDYLHRQIMPSYVTWKICHINEMFWEAGRPRGDITGWLLVLSPSPHIVLQCSRARRFCVGSTNQPAAAPSSPAQEMKRWASARLVRAGDDRNVISYMSVFMRKGWRVWYPAEGSRDRKCNINVLMHLSPHIPCRGKRVIMTRSDSNIEHGSVVVSQSGPWIRLAVLDWFIEHNVEALNSN